MPFHLGQASPTRGDQLHLIRLDFPERAAGLVDIGNRLATGLFTAAKVGQLSEQLFVLAIREEDELVNHARHFWHPFEWQ